MLTAEWKQYLGNTYYFSKLFIDGKLFYLEAAPNGLYKVFRLRNPSPHLSPANANPMYIASGMKDNLEEAKERALKALEDYLGKAIVEKPVEVKKEASEVVEEISEPEPVVEETVTEEPLEEYTEPEPPVEEVEEVEAPQEDSILKVEPSIEIEIDYASEEPLVTLIPSLSDMRIKYTTNGRELSSKSRVYKEPFTAALGSIIKAGIEKDGEVVQLAEQEVKINEN